MDLFICRVNKLKDFQRRIDGGGLHGWVKQMGIFARSTEQHGDKAPIHAAMKADEMLEAGDMDGKAVWVRIMKAVEELLSGKPPDGAAIH